MITLKPVSHLSHLYILSRAFSGFSLYFCINEEKVIWFETFALMTTGAFNRNVGKLFSEFSLVPDNLPFIKGLSDKPLIMWLIHHYLANGLSQPESHLKQGTRVDDCVYRIILIIRTKINFS